jgi:hypothetical protein
MNRPSCNRLSSRLLSCGFALALCGCVSVQPPTSNVGDFKVAAEKSYTLNTESTVNVGEPIIVRKSYSYREVESLDRAQALNDFEAHGSVPLNSEVIRQSRKDEILPVVGTTTVKKNACRIVLLGVTNNNLPIGLLVKLDTGEVIGAVWRNGLGSWGTGTLRYTIEPKNTMFAPVKSVIVAKDKPYENFEIVFTGRIGQNATFLYREFSPDDLAKPAFYQNLTYNLETEDTIQFKKLRIEVLNVSNESIRFKVLRD